MLNRKCKTYIFLMMLLTSLFIYSSGFPEVPHLINYQGRLTDDGSLADGSYDMHFYIVSEGTSFWDEAQTVLVNDGIFNVQLGAVIALPSNIFSIRDLYLEVAIVNEGVAEVLTPMHQLTSVPFAMRAIHADEVDGIGSDGQLPYNDNGTMAGAPIFYDKNAPYDFHTVTVEGSLKVEAHEDGDPSFFTVGESSNNLMFTANPAFDTVDVSYGWGSGGGTIMRINHEKIILPDWFSTKFGIGVNDPIATLDVNGYAKLKPYSAEPFSCATGGYGIISMNSSYDLCVCRPYNLTKEWRKVEDINQLCWP